MDQEKVIVIDFGGQYNQLVARRVRECNVYCEIYSYKTDLAQIKAMNPKGIILTGGPNSCYEDGAPTCTKELFELGVPVLGLCYGAQLMQHVLGGKVEKAPVREYGKTETFVDKSSALFSDVSEKTIVWMSHFDYISQIAPGFKIVAHTADCPVAAAECTEKNLYAIQFHPEVLHTQEGTKMLHNFVRGVCGCAGTWKMDAFVENTIKEIREKVGSGKVLLALSGGVDSSVAAGLLSRAIGKQLTCVFVDHGLLRKNEGDEVEGVFGPNGQFDLNFIRVNAQERYYSKLAGVTEPEAKRKIIGEEFIHVFEEEAKKIGAVDFLAQGTIYPDVVESGLGGESAVIKSHHNVGGLPDFVDFKEIIEPLRNLFKDEVRKAGLELGIPENLVFRQPFPGPGLGIRIIGEVTADGNFSYGNTVITVDEAENAWKGTLEKVFKTVSSENDKEAADRDEKLYRADSIYVCKNKVAKPRVFIPVFPGTNCEYDSTRAFERAGAEVDVKVFKNLTAEDIHDSVELFEKAIDQAQIIMFPGGFSAGDEPDGSAKFFATAFQNAKIKEAVMKLINERDGLALGICNGFQALIKLGLVPYGEICGQKADSPTLTFNTIGRHISKMVYTKVVSNKSPWLQKAQLGGVYCNPASHGEGRFVANEEWLQKLFANGQVATQYVTPDGQLSVDEEWNVNGSYMNIEGITSPDGRILGKMAHSERRGDGVAINIYGEQDIKIFESGVEYFK